MATLGWISHVGPFLPAPADRASLLAHPNPQPMTSLGNRDGARAQGNTWTLVNGHGAMVSHRPSNFAVPRRHGGPAGRHLHLADHKPQRRNAHRPHRQATEPMRMLLSFSMVVNRPCWLAAFGRAEHVLESSARPKHGIPRRRGAWTAACRGGGASRHGRIFGVLHGSCQNQTSSAATWRILTPELNVDWTRLLPCPAVFEEVLDAWSDAAGTLTVLTQRLTPLDGYQTVLHQLDSTGVWLGESLPEVPQGFRAATKVDWTWVRHGSSVPPARNLWR